MTTQLDHLPAKLCTRCSVSKPRSEFSERWQKAGCKEAYRASNAYCKACAAEKARERSPAERATTNLRQRDWKLKTTYGLSLGDYDRMLVEQGGGCAICGTDTPKGPGRFSVDHCHSTGRVRGLLCSDCNRGLGGLQDDADVLRKAIAYLERYR